MLTFRLRVERRLTRDTSIYNGLKAVSGPDCGLVVGESVDLADTNEVGFTRCYSAQLTKYFPVMWVWDETRARHGAQPLGCSRS